MPIYVYECPKGHGFEKIVSMSQHKSKIPCEKCDQEAQTIVQPVRSSGWYQREGWEDEVPMDV